MLLENYALILIWLKQLPEMLYQSLRLEACKFIKKETLGQVFSYEFYEIFQVTCLVKIKFFYWLGLLWFDNTNYVMQNTYKNLDKALSFSRNQAFCLKIWKLWRVPTVLQFNIFCWNFAHVFYLPMFTKGCVGFFLFYLDLSYLRKLKRTHSTHSFFTLL